MRAIIGIAASLIVLVAGYPTTGAPPRQRVVMDTGVLLSSAPYFLAIDRGYFQRFGIDVSLQRVGPDASTLPLLNLGSLDVVYGQVRPLAFELVNRGGRIRAVAAGTIVASNCTTAALVASASFAARHPKTQVRDLRGARIGIAVPSDGSLPHLLAVKWLERGGLTPDDVTFIRLPLPAQADAMARGTVDAGVLAEPYLSAVLARGAGIVLDRSQNVGLGMPINVTFFGPNLRNQPGLAARVLAAYLLGVRDYMAPDARRNAETLAILSRNLGQTPETVRAGCWSPISRDGRLPMRGLETLRDWQYQGGFISSPTPVASLVDDQYLRAAWRLLQASGERIP